MWIYNLFHKLKAGFQRLKGSSIPYLSSMKRYGNQGEDSLILGLQRELPDSKIKRNIIIETDEGNAEIDCLVLYQEKLFAIEVKHWKGRLIETE